VSVLVEDGGGRLDDEVVVVELEVDSLEGDLLLLGRLVHLEGDAEVVNRALHGEVL
jgi:hypothetical protein